MVGLLAGWLVCWQVGWLVGWFGWLVGWPVGRLDGWLGGRPVGRYPQHDDRPRSDIPVGFGLVTVESCSGLLAGELICARWAARFAVALGLLLGVVMPGSGSLVGRCRKLAQTHPKSNPKATAKRAHLAQISTKPTKATQRQP